jgi:hypothetical protein
VKLQLDHAKILQRGPQAHERAVADVVKDAQARAPVASGKFKRSIRSEVIERNERVTASIVGSPLASARVKERGGFMEAKRADRLYIPLGADVRSPESVRVAAQPTVVPAGDKYPDYMARRLKELSG